MHVIAMYDVGEKRVVKMLKLFRQYLFHVQRSVFEGDLTETQLTNLQKQTKIVMEDKSDSVIFFVMDSDKYLRRQVLGTTWIDPSETMI